MTGLWIVLGLLAFLLILLLLPVSVHFLYNDEGFDFQTAYGPFRLPISGEMLKKKGKKMEKPKKAEEKSEEKTEKSAKKKEDKVKIFLSVLKTLGKVLSKLRKKIKIKEIEVNYTAAGDDPCSVALAFGGANAVLGTVRAALENFFILQKASFQTNADFDAKVPSLTVQGSARISLGSLLWIAILAFFTFMRHQSTANPNHK